MKEKKKIDIKKELLDYLKVILITVVITYSILSFIQISRVVGDSMEPNYHNNNIVLVNKKFYSYSNVKYGDVVVAETAFGDKKEQIIKRVIGKEGDTIACVKGYIYRNKQKLNETYIKEKMEDNDWSYKVGKGQVFVMGDNRNNSSDSRVLGALDFKEAIVGKVFFKFF